MIPFRLILCSMLFIFLSINSYECAAKWGLYPVKVDYQSNSNNAIIRPKAISTSVVSGEELCGKSPMTMWIYSKDKGADGIQAYPIAMPCDLSANISVKDFIQAYLDEARKTSGGGSAITFPEGTFPADAIMHSLCIDSDGHWDFGCSEASNSSGSSNSSLSCSATKNLVFYHEGVPDKLHGDMVQQTLPVECSGSVDATITLSGSPSNSFGQAGAIYIDGAGMLAKFYVNTVAQEIGEGLPIHFKKGITDLTFISLLLNRSDVEHKPGLYKAHGVLTITID
ncbi:hypothetical protein PANPB_00093 (plasmid) [Pantoea sp. Nvir]|uniref:hypothetical protein n=1 Tax=Pantoea sp. Nvir TaxID=2576760 RepID=UPI0030D290F2